MKGAPDARIAPRIDEAIAAGATAVRIASESMAHEGSYSVGVAAFSRRDRTSATTPTTETDVVGPSSTRPPTALRPGKYVLAKLWLMTTDE